MTQTLLLNATFEPLKVISWQRAITLFYKGAVEIVEEHDEEGHTVKFSFKLPSIVRLLRYVKIRRQKDVVPFTRSNIYARDGYACQYCGETFGTEDLTFDHVVPQAQGGHKSWENIVTACVPCNRRKDARTPEEAGMALLSVPRRPSSTAILRVSIGFRRMPKTWLHFAYTGIKDEVVLSAGPRKH